MEKLKITHEEILPDPLTGGTIKVSYWDTGCMIIPDRAIPISQEAADSFRESLKNVQVTEYSEEYIDYRKRNKNEQ